MRLSPYPWNLWYVSCSLASKLFGANHVATNIAMTPTRKPRTTNGRPGRQRKTSSMKALVAPVSRSLTASVTPAEAITR